MAQEYIPMWYDYKKARENTEFKVEVYLMADQIREEFTDSFNCTNNILFPKLGYRLNYKMQTYKAFSGNTKESLPNLQVEN